MSQRGNLMETETVKYRTEQERTTKRTEINYMEKKEEYGQQNQVIFKRQNWQIFRKTDGETMDRLIILVIEKRGVILNGEEIINYGREYKK